MASELEVIEDDYVRVYLMYNVFDATSVQREQLVFQSGQTLDQYLIGLPEETECKVALNGIPVVKDDWSEVVLAKNDLISIAFIPEGNDILRMVALLAIVVIAAVVLGPGAFGVTGLGLTSTTYAVAFAVTVAIGSYLINMALPPTQMKASKDAGQSYGYDGAKNTSQEGVPIPVVYGEFNVAGNYVDVFTQNVGDDQYLYGRCVLSDGEIDSLYGTPTLNDQPITDYQDVQWGYTKGVYNEAINSHFNKSIAQFSRSAQLDSDWVQYTTTQSIDSFQLNFIMPKGLIEYNNNGSTDSESSVLEIQYAPYGTTNWDAPGVGGGGPYVGGGGSGATYGGGGIGSHGGYVGVKVNRL